jgi:hypothetical protein
VGICALALLKASTVANTLSRDARWKNVVSFMICIVLVVSGFDWPKVNAFSCFPQFVFT